MTDTIPAAATGLPSRRRALATLAGAGAALSLPMAATAAILATGPDAVLIAHAAMVLEMAERSHAACTRICDLESEVERRKPIASRPKKPADIDVFDTVYENLPDGGFVVRSKPKPIPADVVETHRRQTEARAAWEAELAAIQDDVGLEAATDLHSDLYAALEDAVRDLTPMVPTTMAGLAAKARAALGLEPDRFFALNDWEHALVWSVASDAVAIGGAA